MARVRSDNDLVRRVVELWRCSGRTPKTVQQYLQWVRRFRAAFVDRAEVDGPMLTRDRVDAFAAAYSRARRSDPDIARRCARHALRAWACALGSLGFAVPPWVPPPGPRALSPMLTRFVEYRLKHGGVAPATARSEPRYVANFLAFLRKRGRRPDAVRIVDIDEFVAACSSRMTRKTVAGICSALRAFLRFRFAVGRLRHDLAPSVVAPRIRSADRPPRALPWKDVQRLLHAINVRAPLGRRDFAMLLTMATYGMGAGEALGLRLDDIDWHAHVLRVRRPKTGAAIVLPLLDPVARALAGYLRRGRPAHAVAREIFVSHRIPHQRLSASAAIRHRLVKYATAAGLTPVFIGSHVLRHSHATHQIEGGAPPKVVGDILGHRRPSSTSAYVRVATERLRRMALPVPT
ncbi:MAG TPA: tyrosine-type recombinase/integrase [Casimicrobiaceae bacterium]